MGQDQGHPSEALTTGSRMGICSYPDLTVLLLHNTHSGKNV